MAKKKRQKNTLPSRKGSESEEEVYAAVGHFISQWEGLETRLSLLFCGLLGGEPKPTAAVYANTVGFHNRAKLLAAALDAVYEEDDEIHLEISAILYLASRLSKKRNELAHGQLHEITKGGKRLGFFWVRPSYMVNMWPIGEWPKNFLTAEEINQQREACKGLQDRLQKNVLDGPLRWKVRLQAPQLRGVSPQT